MATFFGKLLKGIGKAAKYAGVTALSAVTGMQLGASATSPVYYPPPAGQGQTTYNGGWLPEVTVTAPAVGVAPKPIGQKLIDLLDVASGNRPFITDVGVSESTLPKWAIPAALGLAGFFLFKSFSKR